MGRINEGIKVSYQQITSADFTPDIDGAFDVLFAETLKDWKSKQSQLMVSKALGKANPGFKKRWTYEGEI